MAQVLGGTTGRVIAGLALTAGLVGSLAGSAAAAPPSQPSKTVRPVQLAGVPRLDRVAPPAARSAGARRQVETAAATAVRAPRVLAARPVSTVRGHAAAVKRSGSPPARVGSAVKFIRLADGTVIRVR